MTDTQPIQDAESLSETPVSFVPHENSGAVEDSGPTATIVYAGGSEVVSGFEFIEEVQDCTDPYPDMPDGEWIPVIRVWYSDPADDDDDYVDYDYGNVTEVSP